MEVQEENESDRSGQEEDDGSMQEGEECVLKEMDQEFSMVTYKGGRNSKVLMSLFILLFHNKYYTCRSEGEHIRRLKRTNLPKNKESHVKSQSQ